MYHCYFLINYIGPPKVFFLSFVPLFKKFAHHWSRLSLSSKYTLYYYLQSKPSSRKWTFLLCLSIIGVCTGPIADMTATHVVHIYHLYLNSLAIQATEDTHGYYDILDIISLSRCSKDSIAHEHVISCYSMTLIWTEVLFYPP